MKYPFRKIFAGIALILAASSCRPDAKNGGNDQIGEERGNTALYSANATQYGVRNPETFITMQNRKGLRIELNLDQQRLQLWISPKAGKSLDYFDRNFSNRDDHCDVFDKITFPGISADSFVSCDYDPFYTVVKFRDQTMHILNLADRPAIMIWFDKAADIDFKSDKSDSLLEKSPSVFSIEHKDRGYTFNFAAVLGKGSGNFRHMLAMDRGRSIYAQANLIAGQPVIITGELEETAPALAAKALAQQDPSRLVKENTAMVDSAVNFGMVSFRNQPELQTISDLNRKIAWSMQDENGAMRSSSKYIYYLIWFRDGGMNTAHLARSGWVDPSMSQVRIALKNPNVSDEDPNGIFFGQLMAGPITKWEEDGLFYVVWPAFLNWTMTGNRELVSGKNLETMYQAMDWLERYCYDPQKGLFGRYHYCETPLSGSRGDGWDNAVGRPTQKWPALYEGHSIVRSYDIYINNLSYSTYMMLAMMSKGQQADEYFAKAKALGRHIQSFFNDKPLPDYGDLVTGDGRDIEASPYGLDQTDYIWSLTLPGFYPDFGTRIFEARKQLFTDLRKKPKGAFFVSYLSLLSSLDTEYFPEDSVMSALQYLVPQCVRPGKYLPMANTIPEIIDVEDGHPFHDVRPIVFSIAPWLATMTNLGLRKLPFGLAVRPTKYLDKISRYQYGGGIVNVAFEGKGNISGIEVNGKPLDGTYQVPEAMLKGPETSIKVIMSEDKPVETPVLVSSDVRLDSTGNGTYYLTGMGPGYVILHNAVPEKISVKDENNRDIPFTTRNFYSDVQVTFDRRGELTLKIN